MAELETNESYKPNYEDALPEVKTNENLLDLLKLEIISHEMLDVMKECFSDMEIMPMVIFMYWIKNYDVKCYTLTLDNQIIAVATVREKITKKTPLFTKFLCNRITSKNGNW